MTYASKWESAYARYLDARVAAGEVLRWHYEPVKFILAPRTSYCPDFMILYPDKTIEFVEIKGFRREDAMVKFKIAAASHPEFSWRMVERDKKTGVWTDIKAFCFTAEDQIKPAPKKSEPKSATPSRRAVRVLSYNEMLQIPEMAAILKMKPAQIRALRTKLCLSYEDMAERVGMSVKQYLNLESGHTRLFYHRHVLAIKRLGDQHENRTTSN